MGAKLDSGVGSKRGRPDVNADPNVIPFIDVMLVLLIIFMVTAPIAAVDIKTDMPDSKVLASKRPNKPVWVTVVDGDDCRQNVKGKALSACPAVFVQEEEVTFDEIGFKTREAIKAVDRTKADDNDWIEDQRIYVRASGSTQYKNVTRVMNRLQDARLTKIGLVADDKHK
ncbi:MAG: biopolymer transporter ExbD [Hyphomonadaceae bacterium]|nr:MAG: biopolymer transport protein ExbD [Caulobacteraceae bacterium]MBT9445461.1 biopolymer transporter ExbD [Hyphomonadaceae bacterium]TPW03422.1 MAG: biopolymer transport protein ExbD [Alphaproteobacteria bacterium]